MFHHWPHLRKSFRKSDWKFVSHVPQDVVVLMSVWRWQMVVVSRQEVWQSWKSEMCEVVEEIRESACLVKFNYIQSQIWNSQTFSKRPVFFKLIIFVPLSILCPSTTLIQSLHSCHLNWLIIVIFIPILNFMTIIMVIFYRKFWFVFQTFNIHFPS